MKTFFSALCALLLLAACSAPPPPVVVPTRYLPVGSKVEFFGQIHDESWKPVGTIQFLPRPMSIREAEQWAMSASQQRLGNHWKDFRVQVTMWEKGPVVIWQRRRSV